MDLKFKVINQKLIYKDKKYLVSKSDNYIKLFFDFETVDWNNVNIYVLLRNEEDESFNFHYNEQGVIVPYEVLKNKFFYVSVYGANNEYRITTNQVKIKLFTSGYTENISSLKESSKDIIVELDEKINSKLDFDDISKVGLTGNYNDLKNIPNEFNPKPHVHEDYIIDGDIEELIDNHNTDENSHEDIRNNIEDIDNALVSKSDVGHTHNVEDVSGVDTVAEYEIKKSYRTLVSRIRTYGE